jgi:uncharacterized membrane protein YuzA (DUF378 family)
MEAIMRSDVVILIAMVLVLVGALNWGLVGAFNFDLVAVLFGKLPIVAKVIYILIGIAAVYLIILRFQTGKF